jgi:hypothetical protein
MGVKEEGALKRRASRRPEKEGEEHHYISTITYPNLPYTKTKINQLILSLFVVVVV